MKPSARDQEQGEAGELFVLFDLGSFVGAIASRLVERVVSTEEVEIVRASGDPRDGRVREGIPALTLGSLLELDLRTRAWLLLGLDASRVALGVGECVGAREIPTSHPVPSGAFRARPGAIVSTFRLQRSARRFEEGRFGLVIDPLALATHADWMAAAQTLRPLDVRARREAG